MPGIVRGRSRVDCGAFDAQPGGTRTHKVRFTPIEVAAIDAVEAVLRERLWYAFDRAGLLGPAISDDADRCKLRQLLAAAPFASAASEAGLQETVRDSVRLAYANGSKVELDKTDPTAAYAVVAGRLLEHRGGAVIGTHRGTTALDAKIKTVKDLSDELTRFIGPIADWLVWSAAARTSDLHALYHQLAQEIDAPDQRAEFLALAPKRKAVWHDAGAIVSLTPKGEGVREVSGALEASASLILFRIVLPPSAATPLEEGRQVAEQA